MTMIDWDAIQSQDEVAKQLRATRNAIAVQALTQEQFQSLFDRTMAGTSKIRSLWLLGGVAADYQRFHSVELRIPIELARRLLASRYVDHRVVGLKLLARSSAPDEPEIVTALLRALERRDDYESVGGIHELNMFLDHRYPNGGLPGLPVISVLVAALESLARHFSGDPDFSAYDKRQIDRLTNP